MMSRESVTELLVRSREGEGAALDELLPHVYDELRGLAKRQMGARDGHTLQPTALVNEVYLRMVDQNAARVEDRAHFYGLCARVMRQVLVDHARKRDAQKRGGGVHLETMREHADESAEIVDVIAFHEALEKLTQLDPRKAKVVELRTFSGLKIDEIAALLDVSKRTVEADWYFARAWLRSELAD